MKQYASYRQLWQALLPYYDEREAQAVVRMMLEERFGLTLTDIVCGGVARLDASQQAELQEMMAKLEQGEPIQYVMGYAPFCGRHFHVEPWSTHSSSRDTTAGGMGRGGNGQERSKKRS